MSRTSISEFTLFSLPECQRTPCLKQAPYLKISGSNEIRTHNRLVRKRTLNHLAKLACLENNEQQQLSEGFTNSCYKIV